MPAADVEWALAETQKRGPTYRLYRDYYEGRHRLLFATERFRTIFGDVFRAFADNLSAPVVDAVADRLQLEGFDGSGGATVIDELFGTEAKFRRLAGEVMLESLRSADAYVIGEVTPDGDPVAWPQDPTTMAVEYSEKTPGLIVRAAKVWQTRAKRWRVTVYLDDVTERWISTTATSTDDSTSRPEKATQFQPLAPEDGEAETANDLGRPPVIHFANNAPIGHFGRSELADVVPLQDALNKTIADMLVGSEFAALPQRYAIGVEEKRDPDTGARLPMFRAGVDRLWHTANANAKFGQFDAADLKQFLEVQDSFRAEIARVTGTPLHYFQLRSGALGGSIPSGVSIDRLEGRLVRKAEDRAATAGEQWVNLVNMLRELVGQPALGLEARWAEPANRDEKAELEVAAAKAELGIPLDVILIELGYPPADARRWAQEKKTTAANLMAAQLASFDRGNVPVGADQGAAIAAAGEAG